MCLTLRYEMVIITVMIAGLLTACVFTELCGKWGNSQLWLCSSVWIIDSWPGKPLLYSLLCLAEKVSGGFSPSWPIWGPKVWFRKYLITFKNPGLNPAFWETFIRYIFAKDPASQELSECRNATELALKSEGGKYICLWSGSRQWLFHSSGGTGGGEARAL